MILGDPIGGDGYLQKLRSLCMELGVKERILFHPAVAGEELWQYVGAADVGVMMIENSCSSYYLSLPNKFLECVQSLTPIICSDFPEMHRLIEQYDIGLTCLPSLPYILRDHLETLRTDHDLYQRLKKNLLVAKEDLSWEKEKIKLMAAYHEYLGIAATEKVQSV